MKQGWRFNPTAITATGQVSLPIAIPSDAIQFTGNEDRHSVTHAVAPAVASLDHAAARALPAKPTRGDKILMGGGRAIVAAPTYATPALAITTSAIDGYGAAKEDALAHGASEQDATKAGLENGVFQGAFALAPVPGAKFGAGQIDKLVENKLFAAGTKALGAAGVGGAYAGASQAGSNIIAKTNYDPRRPVGQGVGDAVQAGAIGGLVTHGVGVAREALSVVAPWRPGTPTRGPTPAQPAERPSDAPQGQPHLEPDSGSNSHQEQNGNKSSSPGSSGAEINPAPSVAASPDFSDLGPSVEPQANSVDQSNGVYFDLGGPGTTKGTGSESLQEHTGFEPSSPLETMDDLGPPIAGRYSPTGIGSNSRNVTSAGVIRNPNADWKSLRDFWDQNDYADILSIENRFRIDDRLAPRVDEYWTRHFPEDEGLYGEPIHIHHIGGLDITIPLPKTRHIDLHRDDTPGKRPGRSGSPMIYYSSEPEE